MVDVLKCLEFINLQKDINQDIDMKGETSPWKAAQLDVLVDGMNQEEREFVLEGWSE